MEKESGTSSVPPKIAAAAPTASRVPMPIRQTHTYAKLSLSQASFDEIKTKLLAAGYHHSFDRDDGEEVIDMHGIGVVAEPAPAMEPGTASYDGN